jgi:hypothetical protein
MECLTVSGKQKAKRDDPEQSKRFEDMAREIGANTDEETFERVFKKVVETKRPAPSKTGS